MIILKTLVEHEVIFIAGKFVLEISVVPGTGFISVYLYDFFFFFFELWTQLRATLLFIFLYFCTWMVLCKYSISYIFQRKFCKSVINYLWKTKLCKVRIQKGDVCLKEVIFLQ